MYMCLQYITKHWLVISETDKFTAKHSKNIQFQPLSCVQEWMTKVQEDAG